MHLQKRKSLNYFIVLSGGITSDDWPDSQTLLHILLHLEDIEKLRWI